MYATKWFRPTWQGFVHLLIRPSLLRCSFFSPRLLARPFSLNPSLLRGELLFSHHSPLHTATTNFPFFFFFSFPFFRKHGEQGTFNLRDCPRPSKRSDSLWRLRWYAASPNFFQMSEYSSVRRFNGDTPCTWIHSFLEKNPPSRRLFPVGRSKNDNVRGKKKPREWNLQTKIYYIPRDYSLWMFLFFLFFSLIFLHFWISRATVDGRYDRKRKNAKRK